MSPFSRRTARIALLAFSLAIGLPVRARAEGACDYYRRHSPSIYKAVCTNGRASA